MRYRSILGTLCIASALAACDSPTRSDVPSFTTETTFAIVDSKTQTLRTIAPPPVSASIVGTTASAPMTLVASAPGVQPFALARRALGQFVDARGHRQQMSVIYRAGGGPPAAVQSYVDGELQSTSAFTWSRIGGNYVRVKSVVRVYRKRAQVGQYTLSGVATTVAVPCRATAAHPCPQQMAARGGALARAAFGLLASCSTPLHAQGLVNMSFTFCRTEWVLYGLASTSLAISAVALAACPECGATEAAFAGAMAATTSTLDKLISCMIDDPNGGMSPYTSGHAGGNTNHAYIPGVDETGQLDVWAQ